MYGEIEKSKKPLTGVNGGREETLNESSKRSHYKRTRRTSISS